MSSDARPFGGTPRHAEMPDARPARPSRGSSVPAAVTARLRAAFLHACELDVAVTKPGNVSDASAGHGMQAAMFRASALAAVGPLCSAGAPVGARIEAATEATWAAAGCNTNLGIVLLCAPLAAAAERTDDRAGSQAYRAAVQAVLADLTAADTAAAFRAIARANPGGLGEVPEQDVHAPPTAGLLQAMALAADRDLVARQYAGGYAELFATGLPALPAGTPGTADVQRLYLAWLSAYPDSHIVRKHGLAVAQTVMQAAQGWVRRLADRDGAPGDAADAADWARWDASLKSARINPGTTADLTVATLMAAAWLRASPDP